MKRQFVIIASLVTLLMPTATRAITTVDQNSVINNSVHYIANDADCAATPPGSAAGGGGGGGANAENEKAVWDALIAKGLPPFMVAGIMGNMQSESHFDPFVIEGGGHSMNPADAGSGGYGLVQWTPGSKLIPMLHNNAPSIPSEIDALWWQLTQGGGIDQQAGAAMFATSNLTDATVAFETKYERHLGAIQPDRVTQARAILNDPRYGNGAPETGSPYTGPGSGAGGGAGGGGAAPTPGGDCPNAIVGGCTGGTVLGVPAGGKGVPACYFNQSQVTTPGDPYQWGECGCLPTSTLTIRATLENNPQLNPLEVLNGLRSTGGIYTDGCQGVSDGALNYFRSLGYKVTTILHERSGKLTPGSLSQISQALAAGSMILTHTSVSVDSAGTSGTSGHFLVIYGVDAQGNFYVSNPGARADNNKPISPDRIMAWLDMAEAIKK